MVRISASSSKVREVFEASSRKKVSVNQAFWERSEQGRCNGEARDGERNDRDRRGQKQGKNPGTTMLDGWMDGWNGRGYSKEGVSNSLFCILTYRQTTRRQSYFGFVNARGDTIPPRRPRSSSSDGILGSLVSTSRKQLIEKRWRSTPILWSY